MAIELLRQYLPALPFIYCCKGLHATGFQGSIIYLWYLFITIISMLAVLYIKLFLLLFLKYIPLWQYNQFPFILRGVRQTILISTVNYKQGLIEELWGPFSKKWNQIVIFKNANKLHESSWKRVIIDITQRSNIPIKYFSFYMHFLRLEVFDFFHVAAKNVMKELGRSFYYYQLFLVQVRTMKKLP